MERETAAGVMLIAGACLLALLMLVSGITIRSDAQQATSWSNAASPASADVDARSSTR